MPSNWLPDPKLKVVKLNAGKKEHEAHNKAVTDLVVLLDNDGNHNINYDHVQLSIPKHKINLKVDKRIFDVGYVDVRGNTVLLEVKVLESKKTPRPLK